MKKCDYIRESANFTEQWKRTGQSVNFAEKV